MAPTKLRPMEHEFKTKAEIRDFAECMNEYNPTSKKLQSD